MMTEEEQMRMELQRMQRRADEVTDEVIYFHFSTCFVIKTIFLLGRSHKKCLLPDPKNYHEYTVERSRWCFSNEKKRNGNNAKKVQQFSCFLICL